MTILTIAEIQRDPRLQIRDALCPDTVERYRQILADAKHPHPFAAAPVVGAFQSLYYLIDGWHRLAAYEAAGRSDVLVQVLECVSWAELRQHAAAANMGHGLALSNAEKRRAAEWYCQAEAEAGGKPAPVREVAARLGISRQLVSEIRRDMQRAQAAPPAAASTRQPVEGGLAKASDANRWQVLCALEASRDAMSADDISTATGLENVKFTLRTAAKAGHIAEEPEGSGRWLIRLAGIQWLDARSVPPAAADAQDAGDPLRFGASTLGEVQALVADYLPALRAHAPGMSEAKARVLLAIWATTRMPDLDFDDDGGPISRAEIEAITAAPLDVHAGQLRRQGLISGDHEGYYITEAGNLLVGCAVDGEESRPAQQTPTPNGTDPELTHPRIPDADPADDGEEEEDQPPTGYPAALAALCERAAALARRWRARPPLLTGALLGRLVQIHGLNAIQMGNNPTTIAALTDAQSLNRLGLIMHDNICQDLDDLRRAPCMPRSAPIEHWTAYLDWLETLLPTDQVLS